MAKEYVFRFSVGQIWKVYFQREATSGTIKIIERWEQPNVLVQQAEGEDYRILIQYDASIPDKEIVLSLARLLLKLQKHEAQEIIKVDQYLINTEQDTTISISPQLLMIDLKELQKNHTHVGLVIDGKLVLIISPDTQAVRKSLAIDPNLLLAWAKTKGIIKLNSE